MNYFLHRSMVSTWCKLLKNSKDKIFFKMKDEIWRGRLCFYFIEASATYLSFRNILESIFTEPQHATVSCWVRRILPSQPYWEFAQLWVSHSNNNNNNDKKLKKNRFRLFFSILGILSMDSQLRTNWNGASENLNCYPAALVKLNKPRDR